MEPQQIALLVEIAIESATYMLILFSLIALIVGILLLFSPQKMGQLKALSDRWLTPRKSLKPLEIPRESDAFLYRHHQWIGAMAIILPIITIYLLLYSVAEQLPRSSISRQEHYLFWSWLFESATLFLWMANIFAFLVGIVIFFRPSLLKWVEESSNRWFSTRQGLRKLDRSYPQLDQLMMRKSHWTGIFLIAGSLYILVLILTFMFQHPDWLVFLTEKLYKS